MGRAKKFRKIKFDETEYGWSVRHDAISGENSVLLWDTESKEIIHEFTPNGPENIKPALIEKYIKDNIL